VSRAAQFLHAGDYGMMMNTLDKYLVLSEETEMASYFGSCQLYKVDKYRIRIITLIAIL